MVEVCFHLDELMIVWLTWACSFQICFYCRLPSGTRIRKLLLKILVINLRGPRMQDQALMGKLHDPPSRLQIDCTSLTPFTKRSQTCSLTHHRHWSGSQTASQSSFPFLLPPLPGFHCVWQHQPHRMSIWLCYNYEGLLHPFLAARKPELSQ